MRYLLNTLYLLAAVLASPWLIYKAATTGKYRRGMLVKLLGNVPPLTSSNAPVIWFHGVSVGEIHLLRQLVAAFRSCHPDWRVIISTTTDTGLEEARKHFADLTVILWPLDFTWAVKRALHAIKPRVVVLAEGEIWPNFVHIAHELGIRLAIINGRMSPRSAVRYHKLRRLTQGTLSRFDAIGVQSAEYQARFQAAGGRKVVVTGSVKYDGACTSRDNTRTLQMRKLLGVQAEELVLVAGSTQDPEETILLEIYTRAIQEFTNLRLILVPRQKERFEPVAVLLERLSIPFVRRSQIEPNAAPGGHPVILLDTFGELSAVWGLADVAFVGGTLDGKRGGQNMIEPAAYGAAVVFGPHSWNFKDTVTRLLDCSGAIKVQDASELNREILRLLGNQTSRQRLGEKAQAFVLAQQGATERTLDLLEELIARRDLRLAS